MAKQIRIIPENCTGCYICEQACSFHHTDECRPNASRVTVVSWGTVGLCTPLLCMQCDEAPCAKICPEGAIKKTNGVVVIDDKSCIKCKMCMIACPFGNIKYDDINSSMIKCDQCGGDPECVKICPSGALIYGDAVTANLIVQQKYASQLRTDESKEASE
ncbi:MAG: 4Fe-4S dicluster domain-containing protein [Syntrophomonas sp.]